MGPRDIVLTIERDQGNCNAVFSAYHDPVAVHRALDDLRHINQIFEQELGIRRLVMTELSEIIHCLCTGSLKKKAIKSNTGHINTSFDCYNPYTDQLEQIKSCIVNIDCTSFGPDSDEDVIFFYDFYNNGILDGTHNVYCIDRGAKQSLKQTVLNHSKNETFENQQNHGKRPRLSLKKWCESMGIEPIVVGRPLPINLFGG